MLGVIMRLRGMFKGTFKIWNDIDRHALSVFQSSLFGGQDVLARFECARNADFLQATLGGENWSLSANGLW